MSEQTSTTENSTAEEAETTTAPVAPAAPVAAAAKPAAPAAPVSAPSPPPILQDNDDDDDDDDDDDSYHVPSDYAPSGSGRPRRIGSDVRVADIDYKNIAVLSRFLDSRGRILSRRKTRVSAKVQRRIVVAIKRARHLALLPYTADQTRIVRKRR
jgi:small subunit ribosomal protein S18